MVFGHNGVYDLVNCFMNHFRAFLNQYFFVAEIFTGTPGKYVSLKETIRGFAGIVAGAYDHIPEQAFYMVGTIDEALEKAKTLTV